VVEVEVALLVELVELAVVVLVPLAHQAITL
jgi:hypothetical protein